MKAILTKETRDIFDRNAVLNRLYMISDFAHMNNDGVVVASAPS